MREFRPGNYTVVANSRSIREYASHQKNENVATHEAARKDGSK